MSTRSDVTGDLKPPSLDEYVDGGQVAVGAQGEIREVTDTNLLRTLAMKLLDADLAGSEAHRKRFVEEAQITAQLDHPNIPPVHRIGMDGAGRFYFTMKFVRGSTLESVLQPCHHYADVTKLFDVLKTFVTVCNAVAFAHARGVIHRDLKPENIMVAEHGEVYVMDWGIAQIMGHMRPSERSNTVRVWAASAEEKGTIFGTPEYMAPEQAMGGEIDQRSDIFALGAILYRIAVGRSPFASSEGGHWAVLANAAGARYEDPSVASAHRFPPSLYAIIRRAMAPRPEDRYQDVGALRYDVDALMRDWVSLPTREFPVGTTIIREGDVADCAYVIVKGMVRVYKNVGGRTVVMRELGAGSTVGEAAIFSAHPRTASVDVIEPLTALIVTRAVLEEELGHASTLAPLVRSLASRFREIDRELVAQKVGSVANAVARAALVYVAMYGVESSPSQKAVAWSPLCRHLRERFAVSADDAAAAVRSVPEALLDVEGDILYVTAAQR